MKQPPPAHAMAPTRTVCIRQSCLAFRAGVRSSVGFAHGQPRSQGSRRRGRAGGRARAQNTEGRSQRVTTPAHIPSTPHKQQSPRPKRPVSSGPLWSFSKACSSQGRTRGRSPPQPVTAEEKPHAPGLAQPAALWSQGWSAAWDKHARALAQATAPGHCSMFGCQRTAFRNG